MSLLEIAVLNSSNWCHGSKALQTCSKGIANLLRKTLDCYDPEKIHTSTDQFEYISQLRVQDFPDRGVNHKSGGGEHQNNNLPSFSQKLYENERAIPSASQLENMI